MLLFHDQSAAHGDERPVTSLVQSWVAGIMLPAGLLSFVISRNIYLSIASALAIPILAIAQGSIGILKYRLLYGHGPHPITPSHGVVITSGSTEDDGANTAEPQRTISIGGCQCSALQQNHLNNNLNRPPRWIAPTVDDTETPLRLLVIGDSLAIGVGQAKQCTPILPETIAKTISREHNGRTVYWTCHGAPGASTGWIVRELERKPKQDPENSSAFFEEETLCCSDTDESISSDESARSKEHDDYGMWRDRIVQHRRCFRPGSYLGPYDIVVVITGSNDLKSAFFPFLLTGEDAEFRRQARARGGNYTKELRRLISTLVSCMKGHTFDSKLSPKQRAFQTPSSPPTSFSSAISETTSLLSDSQGGPGKGKPLVVFPGLPARALPVFRIAPLRWLSVPIVDILDLHKRRLGNNGEALFVPAPSLDEMADYENCRGDMWQLRHTDRPRMVLRDTSRQDCQRISGQMQDYYAEKDKRVALTGLRRGADENDNPMPANGLFAIDGIHPSDDGYDFWGRYIGHAIVSELKRQKSS